MPVPSTHWGYFQPIHQSLTMILRRHSSHTSVYTNQVMLRFRYKQHPTAVLETCTHPLCPNYNVYRCVGHTFHETILLTRASIPTMLIRTITDYRTLYYTDPCDSLAKFVLTRTQMVIFLLQDDYRFSGQVTNQ